MTPVRRRLSLLLLLAPPLLASTVGGCDGGSGRRLLNVEFDSTSDDYDAVAIARLGYRADEIFDRERRDDRWADDMERFLTRELTTLLGTRSSSPVQVTCKTLSCQVTTTSTGPENPETPALLARYEPAPLFTVTAEQTRGPQRRTVRTLLYARAVRKPAVWRAYVTSRPRRAPSAPTVMGAAPTPSDPR